MWNLITNFQSETKSIWVSLKNQSWDCFFIYLFIFIIFINDLPSVIPYTLSSKTSSIVLFADDTSVIISEPCLMNFERKLNIGFQIMKEWFNSNFLSLNYSRSMIKEQQSKNTTIFLTVIPWSLICCSSDIHNGDVTP